ncbi:MAG: twin-arginine translocation signal domain-containing protein, partial [Deltaproteobacteria bacterium]|nr:twin-arginine translocation signal domain-containing protein [Deltaproteobacteria bacterium]
MVTEKNRRSKGKKVKKFSRRDFIKAAGAGLAAAGLGAGIMIPRRARAGKRQLRIVQWTHP